MTWKEPEDGRCKGCLYRRPISQSRNGAELVCHYLLDTGRARGCGAVECYERRVHFLDKREVGAGGRVGEGGRTGGRCGRIAVGVGRGV